MSGCELKIMSLFEAGARLHLNSELVCLAAHIYHRFLVQLHQHQHQQPIESLDLYSFAAASLRLAHLFYERHINLDDLAFVMVDIIHGKNQLVADKQTKSRLQHSIELAAKIIMIHLDFQVNYKDSRRTTPGLLSEQFKSRLEMDSAAAAKRPIHIIEGPTLADDHDDQDEFDLIMESSSEDDEEFTCNGLTKTEKFLTKNDKYQISSHRYLLHYAKTIQQLVEPNAMEYFTKVINVAWTILCDVHWTKQVTEVYSNHLACISLIMAIECFRNKLERNQVKEIKELWKLLNRKWNLIFCDDLSNEHLRRSIIWIERRYVEYERFVLNDISTFVIDPLMRM